MSSDGASNHLSRLRGELAFLTENLHKLPPQRKSFAGPLIRSLEWAIKRLEESEELRLESEILSLQYRLNKLKENRELR